MGAPGIGGRPVIGTAGRTGVASGGRGGRFDAPPGAFGKEPIVKSTRQNNSECETMSRRITTLPFTGLLCCMCRRQCTEQSPPARRVLNYRRANRGGWIFYAEKRALKNGHFRQTMHTLFFCNCNIVSHWRRRRPPGLGRGAFLTRSEHKCPHWNFTIEQNRFHRRGDASFIQNILVILIKKVVYVWVEAISEAKFSLSATLKEIRHPTCTLL